MSQNSIRGYAKGKKKRFAVVLSGSGMLDGTEIHEAASAVIHLTKHNYEPIFYGVTCPQADVIDHSKGCPMNEIRSAIVEAARIARGKICPINDLSACDAAGVVFPGGFGVAKILTSYAADGAACTVNAEVLRVLQEFHDAQKPLAFMCISAILPARVFPRVKVTLGMKGDVQKWPHSDAVDAANQMGAEVEPRRVDEISFDKQHFVFSTPAFMYNGTFHQVFEGIGLMIDTMNKVI
ncbi:hypothetical protein RUM44_001200 [Polyplax serrata]